MPLSPFHAYYKARTLENLAHGQDKLLPAFASSDIEIYPYQISAAMFALRSQYLKGAILCDDGSLGKSFEAMLIITQRWYEGKQRILIIVPTPLLHQWTKIIDSRFSVPLFSIDNNIIFNEQLQNANANPFIQDGIVITTYDFAADKADYIAQINWDLSLFEEAHHLRKIYTGDNKGASAIREAVGNSFKLLLTATPMQNDIMDLYGLIYFIDETAFPDAKTFYSRYFRKPENYAELADRVSKYCFRTTRPQVSTYVKIPERIPITVDFTPTDKEKQLADMLDTYLALNEKYAFPKMELYDLTLMLFRTLSSSTFALEKTLQGVEQRLSKMLSEDDTPKLREEYTQITAMLELAEDIKDNAKGAELLSALKKSFVELKRLGANKKALIFTENRATQKYLYDLLNNGEYIGKVLMFSGDTSRDYSIIERFENEATILITTDIAAEGFNLEFCSFVVNYDLPYNTLKIEQRINRCHRQGQRSDVIIVNFLNRNNFADVRMLELINKHILQFDGIIGLSDDVIGNFSTDLNSNFAKILATARSKDEIDKAFDEVLIQYETKNKQLVKTAEQSLFTSFNRDIADNVTITPQYIEQRIKEINNDLWELVKAFFEGYNRNHSDCYFEIDEQAQTITAVDYEKDLPHLFYYFNGTQNKPYKSLKKFGMDKNFKPHPGCTAEQQPKVATRHSRITLASIIGRGVLHEIECADGGILTVENNLEPCTIGLYTIMIQSKERTAGYQTLHVYNMFVGKTETGKILTDEMCKSIMELPVTDFEETGHKSSHWLRGATGRSSYHELDVLVPADDLIQKCLDETNSALTEEIQKLKAHSSDLKIALEHGVEALRGDVKKFEQGIERYNSIAEKIKAEKQKTTAQKELKQREQELFMDGMRLDLDLEQQIKRLTEQANLTADVSREFVIKVNGQ